MAQPTPYNRLYDFSDYQEVNPTKPLRGSEVDAELDAIKLTTDQIRANAARIQRDDGALANQAVTPDSLSAGTLAMIHQGEYVPRGAWAATTVYAVGDLVAYNAATYLCIEAHTAQAAFPSDLAASRWVLIANGALSGQASAIDLFEGNAATTTYTLSYTYANSNAAVVFVGGVALIPTQDFTISGTTLTFVSAPPAPSVAGRKNVMVRGTGVEAQLAANAAAAAAADAQGFASSAGSSATAAAASASAAASSATSASGSATTATTQASTATTKASEASASAASALTSKNAAAASQTAAASSQSAAATSATNAATSATTATTQAGIATTQATNAAASATGAAASATTATARAGEASSSASGAASSASAASTSATASGNSASGAATSATQAAASASNAANSATSAATSATSATGSATAAAGSATTATTQAGIATTQATNAASSATAAAGSATTATTQATTATTQATNAAASAAAAAASYDSFDDRYLGAKASAPTLDNDGNALLVGALYFNSTTNAMQVYGSSGWTAAGSSVNGTSRRFRYIATAGQTTFTGADSNGFTLAYDAGYVDVYLNGVRLDSTEYTASSGTSIVLGAAAGLSDELNIVAFGTFVLADHYDKTAADAKFLRKAGEDGVTVSGGNVGVGTAPPTSIAGYKSVTISSTTGGWLEVTNGTVRGVLQNGSGDVTLETRSNHPLIFGINGAEKGRFDISGQFAIGKTQASENASTGSGYGFASPSGDPFFSVVNANPSGSNACIYLNKRTTGAIQVFMTNNGSAGSSVGSISHNGSSTAYNTSSDYRLKEDVQPMTGALTRVSALKPVTYKWKSTRQTSEGFIAHELAEVVPEAVSGEKDAVNEDGSIKPQGIDTSFLVATLTAAMQEQQAIITALTARVAALEGAQP